MYYRPPPQVEIEILGTYMAFSLCQRTPLLGKYTLVRELGHGYTSTSYTIWNKKLALIQ